MWIATPIPPFAAYPRSRLPDILAFSHKRTAIMFFTTTAVRYSYINRTWFLNHQSKAIPSKRIHLR